MKDDFDDDLTELEELEAKNPAGVDYKKPYPDMADDELIEEYNYLSGLHSNAVHLGMNQIRQSVYQHLTYVRVLLDERYLIQ